MNQHIKELTEAIGSFVQFKKDTALFHEGDQCPGMLLLTAGTIKVIKYSDEGKEALLYRVAPDNLCILSVSCLIGNNLYNAEGIAENNIEGIYITHPKFMELLNSDSVFREYIFLNFATRITDLIQKLDDIIFKSLKDRLIDFIKLEKSEINMTHQEIAVELGTSREVISRLLKVLEKEGMIDLSRNKVTIV